MFIRNGEVLGSVLHSAVPRPSAAGTAPPSESTELQPDEPSTPDYSERPKDYDSKADWVAYAVTSSAVSDNPITEHDAAELTKTELIELYGGLTE